MCSSLQRFCSRVGPTLGRIVESDWVPVKSHRLGAGLPRARACSGDCRAGGRRAGTVRWARLGATWLVALVTLAAVVLGAALPSAALGALALGLGAGAIVLLTLLGRRVPPVERVREAIAALGLDVSDLVPSARQHAGSAEYAGRLRRPRAEGPRSRSRRAGRAAPHPSLASVGLPRSTAQRSGRQAGAGRARGTRHTRWPSRPVSVCPTSCSPPSPRKETR